jgi:hypothetical protein
MMEEKKIKNNESFEMAKERRRLYKKKFARIKDGRRLFFFKKKKKQSSYFGGCIARNQFSVRPHSKETIFSGKISSSSTKEKIAVLIPWSQYQDEQISHSARKNWQMPIREIY